MEVVDLQVSMIQEPSWNPNTMDDAMVSHLSRSIQRYGFLVPLVVRAMDIGNYETVGGAQRLAVIKSLGFEHAPCVIVTADGSEARLLSQVLNRVQGEDNIGLRAELVREVLKDFPEAELLGLLPESTHSLKALVSLGEDDIVDHLQAWDKAQAAKLKHILFQLLPNQLEMVEKALGSLLPEAKKVRGESPNVRGVALFLLCKRFLELEEASS